MNAKASTTAKEALRGGRSRLGALGMAFVLATSVFTVSSASAPLADAAAGCRIYVASGDDVTNGKAMDDNASRYAEQLIADHIKSPGWCLFNQGKNGQTSSSYITGGGMSSAYNMRPDFLTIQLGEQNATIVKLITDCFDKVKDHDFSGAQRVRCRDPGQQQSSGRTSRTTTRRSCSRPGSWPRSDHSSSSAVVNYPNPYPRSLDVIDEIVTLCVPLIDTIATCSIRWAQLPPALLVLDQVFVKLNQTLKDSMAPFQAGPNGSRWVYVDTYPDVRGPLHDDEGQDQDQGRAPRGERSGPRPRLSRSQFRLLDDVVRGGFRRHGQAELPRCRPRPASSIEWSQTTKGMGVYPNKDGHQCIADTIWEADTIDPGDNAAQVEAGLRGGVELRHLLVIALLVT